MPTTDRIRKSLLAQKQPPRVYYVPNKEKANQESTQFFRNAKKVPTVETAAEAIAILRTGSSVILCNQDIYDLFSGEDREHHLNRWDL